MEKTFILRSEEDTIGFGAAVGLLLPRGAFVAMYGGLGAGKTTMVRGIASSLGADHRDIMSPTFTIVREHTISVPFFFFFAYRLSGSDELYAIGFDEYLNRDGIIIMEWPENVRDALPEDRLEIHITGNGAEPRVVRLDSRGSEYELIIKNLYINA